MNNGVSDKVKKLVNEIEGLSIIEAIAFRD